MNEDLADSEAGWVHSRPEVIARMKESTKARKDRARLTRAPTGPDGTLVEMLNLQRALWSTLWVERFAVEDRRLVFYLNRWMPKVLFADSEIVTRRVHPEMAFDIVDVELTEGRSMRLFDSFDDCIRALEALAPERRRSV